MLRSSVFVSLVLLTGNVAENKADQNKAKALLANFDALFVL